MSEHERHETALSRNDALAAWLHSSCSPSEQATLRERIAIHDQRLQRLSPAARDEAVVDALLHDAKTNPTLAGALQRLRRNPACW